MAKIIFDRTKRRLVNHSAVNDFHLLPWVKSEMVLIESCTRCGDCLSQCPENIITTGQGGFPEVNFKLGECSFCEACADVCEQPIFASTQEQPWQSKAVVAPSCLANNQVYCRSCAEACPEQALSFELGISAMPKIDLNKCNGCGACVAPCPADAICIKDESNE